MASAGIDPLQAGHRLREEVMTVNNNEPYRSCPVCRGKLSRLMKRHENGYDWDVYQCPNCGSEVWIVPFKVLVESRS